MASTVGKRKAAAFLEDSAKRQRIERLLSPPMEATQESEDDDNEYRQEGSEFSEEEHIANTPVTPFSPGRKKFPSELKTIKCTTHTNERPYVCTYEGCDKTYFEDKHLQQHIKGSHTKERSFPCDWEGCNKSFLTSTRLNRHKNTHTGQHVYRCTTYPPCNEPFRKHQTLQRHIRSVHLLLAPYPCTYVDPVTSVPCEAGFDGATGLRQHVDRVHAARRITCFLCHAPGFKTDRELQAHIRKEHANCAFCDIKCSSQRELMKHIEIHHSGITIDQRKNVLCTYAGCNKRFTKQNNLNTHIRTAHMGQRFICGTFDLSTYSELANFVTEDGCGDDFVSKASLMDHIRTAHLGLKSLVNANRKKSSSEQALYHQDSEYDCMDPANGCGEDDYAHTLRKSKRGKSAKPSLVDELSGIDPRRTIPCLVPTCQDMFIRNYDLDVHMRTAHPFVPAAIDPGLAGPSNQFPYPSVDFDLSHMTIDVGDVEQILDRNLQQPLPGLEDDQADFNWEFQRQALEGGPFWVGADTGVGDFEGNLDEWTQEEEEMRGLIG
ncbi:Strongly-conserved Zn-finger binding protein (TFIIIA) [Cadophora gregata]|uniref:Strongly-conserved Zn-finger binding protein (TFIIIA) n=1 Tax=Cadophora gregata TaxID=51156 RepID=UPI0026DC03E1|nr:Strongly-conserved Zn-finger binding protein (TFIIIA) [Cadophora gregata]KAK0113038.1 Strongly-conserved Zn-finger binding protein (TFIIIA) [Cadophora gregata]